MSWRRQRTSNRKLSACGPELFQGDSHRTYGRLIEQLTVLLLQILVKKRNRVSLDSAQCTDRVVSVFLFFRFDQRLVREAVMVNTGQIDAYVIAPPRAVFQFLFVNLKLRLVVLIPILPSDLVLCELLVARWLVKHFHPQKWLRGQVGSFIAEDWSFRP